MMVDNIQANLYHHSLISHSLSHSNYVMPSNRQIKVQTDWSVDLFLSAGPSAAD